VDSLDRIAAEVVDCRLCPRLVDWREEVAVTRRAAYVDQTYWGRPVPGFGDRGARVVVVGLAPAAHGANRTGRMFTGDRSGDWLYRALWRARYANQPESVDRDDGLELDGVFITSPVKCAPPANKPTAAERDACRPFLRRELAVLETARVLVALGKLAFDELARHFAVSPRPKFGHGAEFDVDDDGVPRTVIGSYHVSQQNTFTGRLTSEMLDAVFTRARELAT
jgi:uracil-DNA glycosylase family 4